MGKYLTTSPKPKNKDNDKLGTVPLTEGYGEQQNRKVSAGANRELDELRKIADESKDKEEKIKAKEREIEKLEAKVVEVTKESLSWKQRWENIKNRPFFRLFGGGW